MNKKRRASAGRDVRGAKSLEMSERNFEELARAKLAEFRYVLCQVWREMDRLRRLVGGSEASEDWRLVGVEVCDSRVLYLRCRVCLRVWVIRGLAAERALKDFRDNDNPLHEYGDMIDVWGCEGVGCRILKPEECECVVEDLIDETAK